MFREKLYGNFPNPGGVFHSTVLDVADAFIESLHQVGLVGHGGDLKHFLFAFLKK